MGILKDPKNLVDLGRYLEEGVLVGPQVQEKLY